MCGCGYCVWYIICLLNEHKLIPSSTHWQLCSAWSSESALVPQVYLSSPFEQEESLAPSPISLSSSSAYLGLEVTLVFHVQDCRKVGLETGAGGGCTVMKQQLYGCLGSYGARITSWNREGRETGNKVILRTYWHEWIVQSVAITLSLWYRKAAILFNSVKTDIATTIDCGRLEEWW